MEVLCGVDCSPTGRHAARVATDLADRLGADLLFEQVHDVPRPVSAELVVVGHRRRGRLASTLIGSTHSKLVGHAACPSVFAPTGVELRGGSRVVLGYSATKPSRAAAFTAGRLASRLGASLVLVHALPQLGTRHRPTGWRVYDAARLLTEVALDAAGASLTVETLERVGGTAEVLARAASALDAALLVVGHPRRGAVARPGSVVGDLLRRAHHPVVMAPTHTR